MFCVARLERKVAVPPSATTKKKEKISFSTLADMEETAPETYNRVEKLADAFAASRGKVWEIGIFRKLSENAVVAPSGRRNGRPQAAGSESVSAFRGALATSARPVAFDKIF
jgi:hypothetical protein